MYILLQLKKNTSKSSKFKSIHLNEERSTLITAYFSLRDLMDLFSYKVSDYEGLIFRCFMYICRETFYLKIWKIS